MVQGFVGVQMMLPPELWAVLLFSGQMADIYTTRKALEEHGDTLEESNPVARWVFEKIGFKGMQALKAMAAGTVAAIGFYFSNEWLWLLAISISWAPAIWNTYLLSQLHK